MGAWSHNQSHVYRDAVDPEDGFAGKAPDEPNRRLRSDVLTDVAPIRTATTVVHRPRMNIMNLPEGAWADVARLQGSLRTASASAFKIDRLIDRLIDRIESGEGAVPEDRRSIQCAIATANRRDRHQARLTRLHIAIPTAAEEALSIGQDQERALQARDALRQIMAKTSPCDSAMILQLALGHTSPDVACSVGLTEAAVRKRLSRLRDEFAYLNLQAA